MRFIRIISVWLVFWSGNYAAQNFNAALAADLQHTIDSFQTSYNLKGISASVFVPNEGIWKGVSGVSHAGVPITPETGFAIASNTKLFTGVLLLKLAEGGLLSLDDSLHEHLPTFNNVDPNITVRQLLNHTSGLSDINIPGYGDSMLADPYRVFQPEEIIAWVPPPLAAPGTGWSYCNTNYLLAGLVAESVTGQTFSQLLRNDILNPLSMDSTYLAVYENTTVVPAHPWQGGMDFSSTPRVSINSAAWSAGAMYSTSSEMVHWYRALMGGEVINLNSLQEMTTFVGSGSYGIGIAEATILGRIIWQHGGTIWGGYNSSVMYDPASGAIICVLINQLPAQAFQVAVGLLADLVDQGLGFHEIPINEEHLLYPNPTMHSFDISIKHSEELPYEIANCEGIVYIKGILDPGQTQISLEHLSKGVYYLSLKQNNKNEVYKVIKQ
ncbi:MAG: serine hydrolase [Sphingomonadales bacterium]